MLWCWSYKFFLSHGIVFVDSCYWICALILYSGTLSNSLTSFNNHLVKFSMHQIMSSFSCLMSLAKIFGTILHNNGKGRHLWFWISVEVLSILPFQYDAGCSIVKYCLDCVEPCSFCIQSFWRFYHENRYFVNHFLHIYWDNNVLLFFSFLMRCSHLLICLCWTIPASQV